MKLKTYEEYNESVKIKSRMSESFNIIYNAATEYFTKQLGIEDIETTVILKKIAKNKKEFGSIDIVAALSDRTKFTITVTSESGIGYTIGAIAHELIHAKQIHNNELSISEDCKSLSWMGKPYISIAEYSQIVKKYDYEVYKNLPWEIEAYGKQTEMKDEFLKSAEFLKLKDLNATMAFLIDNIY